jgi:hypothetical protein
MAYTAGVRSQRSLSLLIGGSLAFVLACGREGPQPEAARQDPAPAPATPTSFARFVATAKTEGRFETAVVRYVDAEAREVDLIGAVHVGETAYYQELQRLFTQYDALLYELVGPKGTVPKKGQKSDHAVAMLQRGLKGALELDFQLDAIDYTPANFVHADLSYEEFTAKQGERGESMFKLILRAMLLSMQRAQQGKGSNVTVFHLLAALASADRAQYLKFLFAQELEEMERMLAAFGGEKGSESAIIGDRNQAAIDEMQRQLAAGKTKLGIFYGAAHLPDMEQRLAKLGFRQTGHRWLTAWDATK